MRVHQENIHHEFEIRLTWVLVFFTLACCAGFGFEIYSHISRNASAGHIAEGAVFLAIVGFLIYGNIGYQLTRIGYFRRLAEHAPESNAQLEKVYDAPAPALTFLIPSYKEEERIIRQTLLSAALQEYPRRRVVLLIDDQPGPLDPQALPALQAAQAIPASVSRLLSGPAKMLAQAEQRFWARCQCGDIDTASECEQLASLYEYAAQWFEAQAVADPVMDHTDAFFVENILRVPARTHRSRAQEYRRLRDEARGEVPLARLRREYARLAALFRVELSRFQRKRYVNLSHEPNKAMNLNTYIGLLGGSYRERQRDGLRLEQVPHGAGTLNIPAADYLITLDADSLLLPGYALGLAHIMERPGNEHIAVAQTPYSAVPDASSMLERIAGATTDIQYMIHQGFTQHSATYWVGANAMLRTKALQDILVVDQERGFPIKRYIQDRTVIEDTESTVDLIDRGWILYNYPERLAYSATPSDFGALVIQRSRWANGGLIILPKLLRYLWRGPRRLHKAREGFFRFHYLTSITGVNLGLLTILLYPFPDMFQSLWLPLSALPYYALYARDLVFSGYRHAIDIVRVYALNLLLLPVNLGGVMRSVHQAINGHKIPFRRTPKIDGRTRVAPAYVGAEFLITGYCLVGTCVDALNARWLHAIFALVNAALLIYAIHIFIGFSKGLDDLRHGSKERARARPAPAVCRAKFHPGLRHRQTPRNGGGKPLAPGLENGSFPGEPSNLSAAQPKRMPKATAIHDRVA